MTSSLTGGRPRGTWPGRSTGPSRIPPGSGTTGLAARTTTRSTRKPAINSWPVSRGSGTRSATCATSPPARSATSPPRPGSASSSTSAPACRSVNPVHEIALSVAGGCRIAYADNDPLVLAFARALLTGPSGSVTHIDADLNDPAGLLAAARDWLDFTQPVAILLVSTLGHIGDPRQDDDEAGLLVTGQLKDALPPGGYLVIGNLVASPDLDAALDSYNATGAAPYRARSAEQFTRLLGGLDLAGGAVGRPAGGGRSQAPSPSSRCPRGGLSGGYGDQDRARAAALHEQPCPRWKRTRRLRAGLAAPSRRGPHRRCPDPDRRTRRRAVRVR